MRFFSLAFFLLLSTFFQAQPDDYLFKDHTYQDYIKSVKFNVSGLSWSFPIIDLEVGTPLMLSFDDLAYDVRDYRYKVIHCDADWTPSDLSPLEYINGFDEARIETIEYSFNTLTPYTHYDLVLPNDDTKFSKSGNYLLIVFDDDDDLLLLTRRFMVVDPQVTLNGKITASTNAGTYRTHQEVDFRVNYENINIRNPQKEIKASVLQNGRWEDAITDLSPFFVRRKELIFDYQGKILFPGGNEYRILDIRDLRRRSPNIANIERYDDYYDVTLFNDQTRSREPYLSRPDFNGDFVIDHFRNSNPNTQNDYAEVLFSYYRSTPFEEELYLYGSLTDWELKEEFKMIYNPNIGAYVNKPELKEGLYNYAYALKDKNGQAITIDTEGSWFDTDNQYLILIYYRSFGSRFDQLIGAYTLFRQ